MVRSVAFGLPGLPVDTHVLRLSGRLGLTSETDPVRVEHELNAIVPASERGALSLRLILHGRRVCTARRPHCADCLLADVCPSAGCWLPGHPKGLKGGAPRRPSGKPICPMRVTGESAQWCGEGAKRFVKVLLP